MSFKEARLRAGLTQEKAAQKLKVDRSTVAKWETGKSLPTTKKLALIAKTYKCSLNRLFK